MTRIRQCKSMDEVRKEIDRLDREIVPLLAERAKYVAQAAGLKVHRTDVVVPARIEDVVRKARKLAEQHDMDPELAEDIYRAMIDAFIKFERHVWDSRV